MNLCIGILIVAATIICGLSFLRPGGGRESWPPDLVKRETLADGTEVITETWFGKPRSARRPDDYDVAVPNKNDPTALVFFRTTIIKILVLVLLFGGITYGLYCAASAAAAGL
jgi:hypothetical protein